MRQLSLPSQLLVKPALEVIGKTLEDVLVLGKEVDGVLHLVSHPVIVCFIGLFIIDSQNEFQNLAWTKRQTSSSCERFIALL